MHLTLNPELREPFSSFRPSEMVEGDLTPANGEAKEARVTEVTAEEEIVDAAMFGWDLKPCSRFIDAKFTTPILPTLSQSLQINGLYSPGGIGHLWVIRLQQEEIFGHIIVGSLDCLPYR